MESCIDLDIDLLTSIAGSLESAAAGYHGPQCYQTLMTTETGKIAVTSDGRTILEALHFSHPVAQMIKDAVNSCHGYTKDGSKTFLILVSSVLRSLGAYINQGKILNTLSRGTGRRQYERQSLTSFGRVLRTIISEIAPMFYETVLSKSKELQQNRLQDVKTTLRLVAQTCLAPHYSPVLSKFFADVLMNLVSSVKGETTIAELISDTVDWYELLYVKADSQPYSETRLFKPFLLNRDFGIQCKDISQGRINAVILCGAVDHAEADKADEADEVFHVRETSQLRESFSLRRQRTLMFVRQCQMHNVQLVICTEGIPQFALDVLQENRISAIHYVLKEDVDFLSFLCDKLPLCTATDVFTDTNLFSFTSCQRLIISGQRYTHLEVEDNKISHHLKHLILCGPTRGMCDQLGYVLKKALQALKNSFVCNKTFSTTYIKGDCPAVNSERLQESETSSQNSESPSNPSMEGCSETYQDCHVKLLDQQHSQSETLPYCKETSKVIEEQILVITGGGTFEVLMSKLFHEFSQDTCSDGMTVACQILSEAFMNIPQSLHKNSLERKADQNRNFVFIQKQLKETAFTSHPLGINRRGEVTDMMKAGVIEPVQSKIHLVQCVLNLLEQILRIDRVVSVRAFD